SRHDRQRLLAHEARPQARQLAFGCGGEPEVDAPGDEKAEDGVAEELEALVGAQDLPPRRERSLVGVAAMAQRLEREIGRERAVWQTEPRGEPGDALLVVQLGHCGTL